VTAPAAEPGPREIFVPERAALSPGESDGPAGAPPDSQSASATPGTFAGHSHDSVAANQSRREDKKTWWERKKEKKRQKWLERQSGGGGQGGAPGGGHHHGGRPDRDRPPIQPPPPSLQPQIGDLPDEESLADQAALDAAANELVARDASPMDLAAVHAASAGDLAQQLRALGETVTGMPPRRALVEQLFAWSARENRGFRETGVLDLSDAGHGFVVHRFNSYRLYPESTYIPSALVKRHGLRRGQEVEILARPPAQRERCPAALRVVSVMGVAPELAREVTVFEELVPYYPTKRILVEAPDIHKDISMRAVDLLTPIGFGQRGLIVAPPRTGKTVLLQNIANSVSNNYPEATLILLLIDERPEEVTDFKRHTKGEVVSSTFDESPESHVHAAEMVIERARRLVETGKDVVILLDSITRLARAYNALAGSGGKTMSGGIESNALQRPKRFFGSARNVEGGGSITILATALIDTNSRMDEVIFEEFKGTGNMELHLDRGLSDKRIFPAINIDRSGTRKEELIYHPDEMLRVYGLRRAMQGIPPVEAMDMFIQRLRKTRTNTEFLLSLNR
jgi:transcription termination factor Rho